MPNRQPRPVINRLLAVLCLLLTAWLPVIGWAADSAATRPIRIGLTPVILDDQHQLLADLRLWLEQRLERRVEFVQRVSYLQMLELQLRGEVDFAWICPLPYVQNKNRLRLVATPVFRGSPHYQAYIIVPVDDRITGSLHDLKGRTFAYSDIDSVSGHLYPIHEIERIGFDRSGLFARSFFTWTNRNVIEAIADGLADGGAVSGYVWETLNRDAPAITARTRVVQKSDRLGFSPIVASPHVQDRTIADLAKALAAMPGDATGQDLLRRLNLDGFTGPDESLYTDIESMSRTLSRP